MNEWLNGLGHAVMLWYECVVLCYLLCYFILCDDVMLCYAVLVLFVA